MSAICILKSMGKMHNSTKVNPKENLAELMKICCPVRFEFSDKPFIVEIQYFYSSQSSFGKLENGYFVFAKTSDARDLLINANFSSDEVFQREYSDIDTINVTLSDLLSAKHVFPTSEAKA
jgi:hypothetical protein